MTSSETAMPPPLEVANTVQLLAGPLSGEETIVAKVLDGALYKVALDDEERSYARSELQPLFP